MMKNVFLCLVLVGCSSPSSSTDGGTDAGVSDSPSGGDTGSGGDGSTSSKPYTGFVDLNILDKTFTSIPVFFVTPDAGPTGGCAGTTSGSCCYAPAAASDGGVVTPPTPVSAGTITVTDGTATIATFTPTGVTYKAVSNPPNAAVTWKGGDTIKAVGAGATVHPFSGSVTAAAQFAAVAPAISQTTSIVIDRTKDFTITWTAVTGNVIFSIAALSGASPVASINCQASDTGTITVPTALLIKLGATDTAILDLKRIVNADASNDNATITIATTAATTGMATFK